MDDVASSLKKSCEMSLPARSLRALTKLLWALLDWRPGRSGVAELDYWLGRCFCGNGFAIEAGYAVVRYAFRTLGLARLTSGYFTENPASDRVLTKLGFVKTGEDERQTLRWRPGRLPGRFTRELPSQI